jgi:hypothetical protein
LTDKPVSLLSNAEGGRRRIFGFAANELAGAMHQADHCAEVGLKKIDRFEDAV